MVTCHIGHGSKLPGAAIVLRFLFSSTFWEASRMFRSLLLVLFVFPYALAQTSAPAQSHEQHAPAQPSQQPAPTPQHSQHASPAQAAPGAPAAAGPRATPAKPVAPTAPVIVLNGFCELPVAGATAPAAAANKANCKKVITKAEFEKIVEAVIPKARRAEAEANPQVMQGIAKQYAEILVMSNEAKKRGLQRQQSTQELLRISQLQVLAQSLLQDLNEKSAPTPAEIEKYYNDNKPAFEEAIVRRVVIPKETAAAPPLANKDAAQPKAPAEPPPPAATDLAAQKAFAEKARARAVAGEDLEKIQKEAFEASKNAQAPPSTQLGPLRRGSLPPDHDAALFALKPGEVSQLFDTGNGWYFYKVESKRAVPLSEVREELTRRLQPQKFNDARTAVANSVQPDLNQDYFGATLPSPVSASSPGATPARPGLQRGPATPRSPRPAPQSAPAQPTPAPESQPKAETQQPK